MEQVKFYPYDGDLMGLETDENHFVLRWNGPGCVLFSLTQIGNAISCHFASDKAGLRHLRQACEDFVSFCFMAFTWCEMLIACIAIPSVERFVKKIGFQPFAKADNAIFYLRCRDD